mgnify:CR=1 FL=1
MENSRSARSTCTRQLLVHQCIEKLMNERDSGKMLTGVGQSLNAQTKREASIISLGI